MSYILENYATEGKQGYWYEVGRSNIPLRQLLRIAVKRTKGDGIARRAVDYRGVLATVKRGYGYAGDTVVTMSTRGLHILTSSIYHSGNRKGQNSILELLDED